MPKLRAKPRKNPTVETAVRPNEGLAKTKTVVKKLKKPTLRVLLQQLRRRDDFLRTMTALYATDWLAPGFVTSYVKERKLFYASIVRYDGPRPSECGGELVTAAQRAVKRVLYKAEGPTSLDAEMCIIDQFMAELGASLKGVKL